MRPIAMGVPIKRATSPQIIEPSENNEIASPIIDRPAKATNKNCRIVNEI